MITDKDREASKTLCENIKVVQWLSVNGVRRPDEIKQIFNTPENIENIASFISRIRSESADQARKEAADMAVEYCSTLFPWGKDGSYAKGLRAAILGDSVVKENLITDHIPDVGEKLNIAVMALEYVASKSLPSSVFESHYSRLQDACAKASDALKEIQ